MKKLAAIIIAIFILTLAVGCSGTGGIPVFPKEILPPYTDTEGDTIYPLGNKATSKDWEIEFRSYTPTVSKEQMLFVTNLKVTNANKADSPKDMTISGIKATITPVEFANEEDYATGN